MTWLVSFIAKSALMQSPVGAFLKLIPAWAWKALAIIALLVAGYLYHQHRVHVALKAADAAGYARARHEDQAAMVKVREDAAAWKQQADQANSKIHQEEQALHEQAIVHNRALADALRLRVQSRAQVQPGSGGGGSLPSVTGAADRSGGSQPQADAGVAGNPTATVSAGPLIDYAEQCDNDHDALIRVEDAWKRYERAWPKPAPAH